jgi:hypothetical protein
MPAFSTEARQGVPWRTALASGDGTARPHAAARPRHEASRGVVSAGVRGRERTRTRRRDPPAVTHLVELGLYARRRTRHHENSAAALIGTLSPLGAVSLGHTTGPTDPDRRPDRTDDSPPR